MPVHHIPEGSRSVSPYLIVPGVPALIDFLKQAFAGEEVHRMLAPDGTVRHAEVRIGDGSVMMAEANEQWTAMPGSVHLYLEDTDAAYGRALEAGASSVMEPADKFYGNRSAGVRDASGNLWWIATHQEDVSPEELERRMGS